MDVEWVTAVLAALPIESRAGRRFRIPSPDPGTDAEVTEGAIKGLVRAIGDEIAGLLVGSVHIKEEPPVTVTIDIAVVLGTVIPRAVGDLRRALLAELPDHVPFPVDRIDVRVAWLIDAAPGTASWSR